MDAGGRGCTSLWGGVGVVVVEYVGVVVVVGICVGWCEVVVASGSGMQKASAARQRPSGTAGRPCRRTAALLCAAVGWWGRSSSTAHRRESWLCRRWGGALGDNHSTTRQQPKW